METKSKKLVRLGFFSTLLATGLHLYLAVKFYSLKFGLTSSSLCNINDTFNCDLTSTSQFASIFGIPIATLGSLTNLALAIFLLNTFITSSESSKALRIGFWLALFSGAISVLMASISILFLNSYCPFCMGAYVLSFITLFVFWKTSDKKYSFYDSISSLFSTNKGSLYIFIAIPTLAFLSHWTVEKQFMSERLNLFIKESVSSWQQRPEIKFDAQKGIIKGSKDPKYVVVEFADYLCPHCKHANDPLKLFINSHSDVQLIFKPYPLDGNCNSSPNLKGSGDGIRCRLANASYCAEKLFSKGFHYHDLIFENQEFFHGVSKTQDVDQKICEFDQTKCKEIVDCMNSEEATNWVKTAAYEGEQAQITGTPTIFINGKKLDGGQNFLVLQGLYSQISK